MTTKQYLVIPFDNPELAADFINRNAGSGDLAQCRMLGSDEYPTKRYNGWTNYETWLVKLWMDNEEPSYLYWQEQTREAYANPIENQYMDLDRRRVAALVNRLKDHHEEACALLVPESGFATDMLNASLSEVNWYEIAEHLFDGLELDLTAIG